jgi:enamine deaminase RidA (YjgF/YER057c/UK114 family)
MGNRRVIEVPGLEHTNPIPMATVIGTLLVSGSIPGKSAVTGEWGRDLQTQCALVFENIARILNAAGGTTGDILKLSVWLKDIGARGPLNEEWKKMFPDALSRPARHTFADPHMPDGQFIQCEIMAVLEDSGA